MGDLDVATGRLKDLGGELRRALAANTVGTLTFGKDLPKNVQGTWGLITNPPWATQPAK